MFELKNIPKADFGFQAGGTRENDRAENSHLVIRRRERKQQKFKSQGSVQRFLSSHNTIYNAFSFQPHLISRGTLRQFRDEANAAWVAATIAA
jgi:putative transposase